MQLLLEKVELFQALQSLFQDAFPAECPTTGCHEETRSDPLHLAVVSGFLFEGRETATIC